MKRACIILSVLLVGMSVFAGISQHRYQEYYNLSGRLIEQNLDLLDQNIEALTVALYWKVQFDNTGSDTLDIIQYVVQEVPEGWSYEVPVGAKSNYLIIPGFGTYTKVEVEDIKEDK